jgi:hypothetical protein
MKTTNKFFKRCKNTLMMLPAVAMLIFAVACEKEETPNPFTGDDNHITSFVLDKDGVSYTAAISAGKVIITVPVNVNLGGATAKCELSENATIQPDPADVTNWESEQVFRVKSYSGVTRDYTYSIVRSDVPHTGNLTLLTQAEVDAFAATGATIVDGNLIIGSAGQPDAATAIVNLDGLSSVKEVKYHIILNSSFAGTNLDGLGNIEKCGGFYIGAAATKIALAQKMSVNLPMLATVGDVILNSDSIQSVSFARLQSVSNLQLSSKFVEEVNFPLLKEAAGNFSLTNASGTANSVLTSVSFPQLAFIGGSLAMQYFSGLTSADFNKLNYVGNGIDVTLNANALEELSFPELATVNGIINIERAPGLLTLSFSKVKGITSFIYNKTSYGNYPLTNLDFSSLETVANEFYIRGIPMESLNLPELKSIGGTLTAWDLKSMTEFNMPKIEKFTGKLYFYNANLLEHLDLSNLTALGDLELVGCLKLTELESPGKIGNVTINYSSNATCPTPVFNHLDSITGQLSLTGSSNTDNFEMANIKHIGTLKFSEGKSGATLTLQAVKTIGTMDISSYRITTLHAPELATVENLTWSNVWSLATIDMPKLQTVTNFTLSEHGAYNTSNARMTNMDAFSGVTSIGKVAISYCAKLVNFSGLANALSGITSWSVTNCGYNPTYQDMVDGRYTN